MSENVAFTEKAIRRAQAMDGRSAFCLAITDYLMRVGRITYDQKRDLFWVRPPQSAPQVAVWIVPFVSTDTGKAKA